MKKILLVTLAVILCASWSFAADFAPTKMVITVPEEPIIYPFDGTAVDITFDLSGASAGMWLVIMTKLAEAEKPVDIRNGFLGWHYVNKIDTTVYVSSRNNKDTGTDQSISWSGYSDAANGGGMVAPGQYTYYLWGYDDGVARTDVSEFAKVGFEWECHYTYIHDLGDDGLPLDRPLIMGSQAYAYCDNNVEEPWTKTGSHYKWEIGSDPKDGTKVDWSHCSEYYDNQNGVIDGNDPGYGWPVINYGCSVYDANDYDTFYHMAFSANNRISTPRKWTFVSDGEALLSTDWGNWDNITWECYAGSANAEGAVNMSTNNEYIVITSPAHNPTPVTQWDMLRVIDYDGEEIFSKMMTTLFYLPDDNNLNGWPNGEMKGSFPHPDGGDKFLLFTEQWCKMYVADLTRLLEDSEDEVDMVSWENGNGDAMHMLDNNWMEDAVDEPWACHIGTHGPRNEGITRHEMCSLDNFGFMYAGVSYHGLDSFAVMAPDGTPVSYGAFADDYGVDNSTEKLGGTVLNRGTAYDGIFHSAPLAEGLKEHDIDYTTWCPYDNAKGVIADAVVAVEDEEVATFSIDQNSPNPFNPTTTVGFNLVEDGNVSIDIFNVAGQKVDTLVNDFMTAGKHSIVWDASGFSAGIYFYTIKSGDFSKTMKMTLLK